MKIFLALTILLLMGFTACMYENNNYEENGNEPIAPLQIQNDSGLHGVVTFSNEFGVGFMFRNNTDTRLYYNDDFRVDSLEMTTRNNRAGTQFIEPGSTKEAHVNWDNSRETGVYAFERDFFLDENLTELYITLEFMFDLIGWYYFTDDADPIPEDLETLREARMQAHLEFLIAGGPSEIIVLASELAVSRTEVAFRTANISSAPFMHGSPYRLLVYENGWRDAPIIIENWGFTSEGRGMEGGAVIDDHINFEWLYGVLPNGRYMIMRNHFEDHGRPGAPRTQEELMIEFIIDDNTPMDLSTIFH